MQYWLSSNYKAYNTLWSGLSFGQKSKVWFVQTSNTSLDSDTWQLTDPGPGWLQCRLNMRSGFIWTIIWSILWFTQPIIIIVVRLWLWDYIILTKYWLRIFSFILSLGHKLLFHELYGLDIGYIDIFWTTLEHFIPHVWGLPSTCTFTWRIIYYPTLRKPLGDKVKCGKVKLTTCLLFLTFHT